GPTAVQVTCIGAQEKLTSKKVMPGKLSNHLNRHAIGRIGAGGSIEHKDISSLSISCQVIMHEFKDLRQHGMIDLALPDFCSGFFVRDNILVFGGTPCMY